MALADGLPLGLHVGTREAFAVRESMPVTVGDSVSVLVSGGVATFRHRELFTVVVATFRHSELFTVVVPTFA